MTSPFLADCNILGKAPPKVYKVSDDSDYKELILLVENLVGADCRAVVVNDEQLYNGYNEISFKETLLNDMARDMICRNAHLALLHTINKRDYKCSLEIYMFGLPESFKYTLIYNPTTKEYTRTIYMTQSYLDRYGDDTDTLS